MESNLRGIVAGVACAVSLLSARELPVDVADVFVFEEGSGVDRQPAYAPLPGGGFVLVHPRYEQGDIDWDEGFADGTFASAKKGVISLVPPSVAKAAS